MAEDILLLYNIVHYDIEMVDSKAVCILYLMNEVKMSKRLQISVSNLTKLLKYMGCKKLRQLVDSTIRCRINKDLKVTHISRMHIESDDWIVAKEVINDA